MNTPRSLSARADLYRRLGQFLSAGIPVVQSLENLHRSPPSADCRPFLGQLLETIRSGGSVTEGFRAGNRWATPLETTLIEASERSGRLDHCLRRLAETYDEDARQLRQSLTALIYPAVILHLAILLAPLPNLVLSGDFAAYALQVMVFLGPIYLVGFGVAWVFLGRHGEAWRQGADQLLSLVPLLGTARRSLALARVAETLDVLLTAGVGVVEAWPLAANASGSPAIRRRVAGWQEPLAAGETPGELLARSHEFPHLFASHYRAGEVSGSLDDSLKHLHTFYQDEGNRRMRALAKALPFIIYLAVVFSIAFYIVRHWIMYYGGMFRQLGL